MWLQSKQCFIWHVMHSLECVASSERQRVHVCVLFARSPGMMPALKSPVTIVCSPSADAFAHVIFNQSMIAMDVLQLLGGA